MKPSIQNPTRWQKFLQSLKKREVAPLVATKAKHQPEVLESRIAPAIIGPDTYGYTADTSAAFTYEDIHLTGTAVLPNDDDGSQFGMPIGFSFPFRGQTFTDFGLTTNGAVYFGGGNYQLGVAANDWVSYGSAGATYYQTLGSGASQRLVVQWYDLQRYSSSPSGVDFEAVFWANGDIDYRYLDMDYGSGANQGSAYLYGGAPVDYFQITSTPTSGQAIHISQTIAPPGTLSAAVDGGGNLTIGDTGGLVNDITVSFDGANLVITDATEQFTSAPAGGVLSNGGRTLTIPVTGSLIFNTGDGNDTLTVDFSGGDAIPLGNIVFNGGVGGNDSMVITGGATGTVTHSFSNANDGSVTLAGALAGTITYTGLEPVTDNLSATDRVFTFTGGAETITLTDAAGANMFIDSTLGESVTFANPTSSLTINANSGIDALTITSMDAAYAGALVINTDGGDSATISAGLPTLASLAVTAATINLNSVNTTGAQTYTGPVLLASDTTLNASGVSFSSTVNSGGGGGVGGLPLIHDYQLNGSLADALGGSSMVMAGGSLGGSGITFGANQGPNLSNSINATNYSIEMFFSFDATTGYRKIVDFKNLNDDAGLYNLSTSLNLYPAVTGPAGAFADGALRHVVITRDGGTGTFTGYVNGVQQFTLNDSSNIGTFTGPNSIIQFLRDDNSTSGGESSGGFLDYVRIYSDDLTPAQVAGLAGAPTPRALTVNAPGGDVTFSGAVGGTVVLSALTTTSGTLANLPAITVGTGGLSLSAIAGDITVNGPLSSATTTALNGVNISGAGNIAATGGTTLTNTGTGTLSGVISGGSLTKQGAGAVTLTNSNTYGGTTTINGGALLVNGSITSNTTVNSTATLGGTGTVTGTVTVASGGNVAPGLSPGIINSGDVSLNSGSNFTVEVNGTTVGTQYDQLNVTGTVSLGNATLVSSGTITSNAGQQVTILNNDGVDAVSGTFNGLAEGATVTINGVGFAISYVGGDGNDVVLSQTQTSIIVSGGNLLVTDSNGGTTNDNLTFRLNGLNVRVSDPSNALFAGLGATQVDAFTVDVPLASITGAIQVSTLGGNDALTVDLSNGDIFPVGGITFDGGVAGSDRLAVIGDSLNDTATYTPDAATLGNGTIAVTTGVAGGTITFTGLEPVDISGFANASLLLPGANDVLTVSEGFDFATGLVPAIRVAGTSNAIAIETVAFFNNTNVVIDTSTVDGVDTISITGAANAHANTNFQVKTGDAGATDVVTLSGAATFAGDVLIQTRTFNLNTLLTAANATIQPQLASTVRIGTVGAANMTLSDVQLTTNLSLTGELTVGRNDGTGAVTIAALNTVGEGYDLEVLSAATITQTGNLVTDGDIAIRANQDASGANTFTMNAGTLIDTTGSVLVNIGTTAGASAMTLRQISADGSITVTSAGSNSVSAINAIDAGTTLTITSGTTLATTAATGTLLAGGAITLNVGTSLDNNASITSSGANVDINAGTSVANIDGTILAQTNVTIDAGTTITINQGVTATTGFITVTTGAASSAVITGSLLAAGDVTVTAGDDVTGSGNMTSNTGNISITNGTGDDIVLGGVITATLGTVTITSDDALTLNGAVSGAGTVQLTAGTLGVFDNNASITSTGANVGIDAGASVTSIDGAILAQTNVTVNAGTSAAINQAVTATAGLVNITAGTSITTVAAGAITAGTTITLDAGTSVSAAGDMLSGTGVLVEGDTSVSILAGADLNGGTGTIQITANNDGNNVADLLDIDAGATLTTSGQNIILRAGLTLGGSTSSDATTIEGTYTTGGGNVLVSADDDITFGAVTLVLGTGSLIATAQDSISVNGLISVTSAAELEFNVDDDGAAGAGVFTMGAAGSIAGSAGLVDINLNDTTGTATLRSISAGVITVDTTGGGAVSLVSGTLDATAGGVTINGSSSIATTAGTAITATGTVGLTAATTFDNNGTITSSGANVDINAGTSVANIDGAILAQTNVTIDAGTTITINQGVTATTGSVIIAAPGTITTNAPAGNITAATLVQIIGDNAVTLNGNIDAGSGNIIVRANQDGGGGENLTIRGNMTTMNADPTAIELTVNSLAGGVGGTGLQTEIEPNGLAFAVTGAGLASVAQDIDAAANWSTTFNANIDDLNATPDLISTVTPHVSVNAVGDGTMDFFSFVVTPAMLLAGGGTVRGVFDIDGAWTGLNEFDVEMHIFDSAGNLVAANDDRGNGAANQDPGSTPNGGRNQDSFIDFNFTVAGTYYVAVAEWASESGNGFIYGDAPDVGDDYTLHISLEQHATAGAGAPVIEVETGNLPIDFSVAGTAQSLDGSNWSIANNPNIANSTTIPHTTLTGGGLDGQVAADSIDVFTFTTTNVAGTVVIDIDGNTFDSQLFLYTVDGTLSDSNNDAAADSGDGVAGASRIENGALSPNTTYYVVVQKNAADPGLVSGDNYLLNISVPGHVLLGGGQGDILIGAPATGGNITLTTGGGGVVLSTTSDDGRDSANVTFDNVTFATGGGAITVNADDTITINEGASAGGMTTVAVTGGGSLTFNANQDNAGANTFTMDSNAADGDATIVTDSTSANALTINVGTTTGTSTLVDILTGNGGGITVNHLGAGLDVDARGVITAPEAGTISLANTASVTINGEVNAGSGLIAIAANTSASGSASDFDMSAAAKLTTTSTAANGVSITVGNSSGGNTFTEIRSGGGVLIDVNGSGSATFSNATSTFGIVADGDVLIDVENAVALNGTIIAGIGIIDIGANTDGTGNEGLTVGASAIFTNINSTPQAIGLRANVPAGLVADDGDVTINTVAGLFTTGNGGTVTISTVSGSGGNASNLTFGDGTAGKSVIFNVGSAGFVHIVSEDTVTINRGTILEVQGGGRLTIDVNQDGIGINTFTMGTHGVIADALIRSDSIHPDAVVINVGTAGGTGTGVATLADIDVTGAGGGIVVTNYQASIATSAGTAGLTTDDGDITLRSTDITIDPTSSIDAGTASINLFRSTAGVVEVAGLTGVGIYALSQAEVNRLTAGSLVIGDPTLATNLVTAINVRGVTTLGQISGTVELNALNGAAGVLFTNVNLFADLDVNAAAGVTFTGTVTSSDSVAIDAGSSIGGAGLVTATNAISAMAVTGISLNSSTPSFSGTTATGGVTLTNAIAMDITGLTVTTSGNILVTNTGALSTSGVVSTASGTITMSAASPLTVGANMTASGDITLTALETDNSPAGPYTDVLTVNSGVTVESTAGNITLRSGDDMCLLPGSTVQALLGSVTIAAGFNDLDGDGSAKLLGTINTGAGFTLSAIEDIIVGFINAPGQTVTLTADSDDNGLGGVFDTNDAGVDIIAETLIVSGSRQADAASQGLPATTGIKLETEVNTLTAAVGLPPGASTGDLIIANTGGMTVTSAQSNNGDVTLGASGTLALTSVVAGGTGDISITTTGVGSNINYRTLTATGDPITINSSAAITDSAPGSGATAGTLSFTAASSISLVRNLGVTNNAAFNAPVGISISAAATVNFGTLTFNSTGAVSISENGSMVIAGVNTAGSLTLAAESGSLTDASDADITSTSASFIANGVSGSITLGDQANNADSFGPLTFNSVGAVSISEDDAVVVTGTNAANSLVLTAETGTITDDATADIAVNLNASFTANGAGGSITLGDAAANANVDTFGSLTFNSVGAVSISEDNAMVVSGTNTATTLTLVVESGSLTDASDADITSTSATFTANGVGGSITLGDEANNADSFGPLTFNSVGAVSISEDDAVVVTGTNTADSLTLNSEASSITDAAGTSVTVTNGAGLTAVTNITLADNGTDVLTVGGTTTLVGPSGIDVGAAGTVDFETVSFTATGAASVSITESNGASVSGTTGNGNIALVSTTGDWTVVTPGVSTGGNVDVTATTGSLLRTTGDNTARVTGSTVTLTAGGNIGGALPTQRFLTTAANIVFTGTGTGSVSITELNGATVTGSAAGGGSINLTTVGGDWTVAGTGLTTTGNQNIFALGGDILRSGAGAVISGASLILNAGGGDGDLGTNVAPLLTAGSSLSFAGSGTGDVFITEADGADVSGTTGSGDITLLSNLGDWTINGDITTTGDAFITATAGNIFRSAGTVMADNLTLTAGAAMGAAGVANNVHTSVNTLTTSSSGDQFITEANGLSAINLNAGVSDIALALTAGAITDTDALLDVIASVLTVSAPAGIGALANPITSRIAELQASATTGGIYLNNTGTMDITGATVATSGDIVINNYGEDNGVTVTTVGDLTISGTVSTPDDVTIIAHEIDDDLAGPPGFTNNLDVTGNVTGDNVTLRAGDDLIIDAAGVVTSTSVMTLHAGFNDLDMYGNVIINGTLNPGTGLVIIGFGDIVFGAPAIPGTPVINAPGVNLTLTSSNGSIYDDNDNMTPDSTPMGPLFVRDIVANNITLNAPNGSIGEVGDTIEITANSITATAGTTYTVSPPGVNAAVAAERAVQIWSTSAIAVNAITDAGGPIDITSDGSMTVNGPVSQTTGENITLFAAGAASDLTLVGTVSATNTLGVLGGDITMSAGDQVFLGGASSIVTQGNSTVTLNAGWPNQPSAFASNVNADLVLTAALNLGTADLVLTASRSVILSGTNADLTAATLTVHADRDQSAIGTGGSFIQDNLDSTVLVGYAQIEAADVTLLGTIDAGTGDIDIFPSNVASPIFVNNIGVGLNISLTDLLALRSNTGTISIGEPATTGTVFIGGLGTVGVGLINADYTIYGGLIDFNGGIVLADNRTLTLDSDGTITGTGPTILDAVVGGAQGTLVIDAQGDVSLYTRVTRLGEATVANGDLSIDNSNAPMEVIVGVTAETVLLRTGPSLLTVSAPITATAGGGAGDITLIQDALSLNGALTGDGVLTIKGDTVATTIGLGDLAGGTLSIGVAELGFLTDGFDQINIGWTDQTGRVTIDTPAGNPVVFHDPVLIDGSLLNGSVRIQEGQLVGDDDASFTILGASINFSGTAPGVQTAGGAIFIEGAQRLDGDTTLESNGGSIDLYGAINGTEDFVVNAVTGNVYINGNRTAVPSGTSVGGENALRSIEVIGAQLTLRPNIHTVGAQTYTGTAGILALGGNFNSSSPGGDITFNGDLEINTPVVIATVNNDITFNGTVDSTAPGNGRLRVNAPGGNIIFNGDVGSIVPLDGFTVGAASGLSLGAFTGDDFIVQVDELDLTGGPGSVVVSGEIEIRSLSIDTILEIGGVESVAPNTLSLSGDDIAAFADGAESMLLIRGSGDEPINVVGPVTFHDPTTIRQVGRVGNPINVNADLTADTPDGSITLNSPETHLGADITTTGGGNIDITNVILDSDVTLDTSMGGGNVILRGTLYANAGGEDLTILTGAGSATINATNQLTSPGAVLPGTITITGGDARIDKSIAMGALVINGGGTTFVKGNIRTTEAGGQLYSDPVELIGTTEFRSYHSLGAIHLADTVDSDTSNPLRQYTFSVTNRAALAGTPAIKFDAAVGQTGALKVFRVTTGGDVDFGVGADITAAAVKLRAGAFELQDVTTSGTQFFSGTGTFFGAIAASKLTIKSTGDIVNTAPWDVSGLATLTARGNDISITGLNHFGELKLTADNVTIEEEGNMALKFARITGTFAATTHAFGAEDGDLGQTTSRTHMNRIEANLAGSLNFLRSDSRIYEIGNVTAGGTIDLLIRGPRYVLLDGTIIANGDITLAANAFGGVGSFRTDASPITINPGAGRYIVYSYYAADDVDDTDLRIDLVGLVDAEEGSSHPTPPTSAGDVLVFVKESRTI